jgi:hypothetical protein
MIKIAISQAAFEAVAAIRHRDVLSFATGRAESS